jgi:DnaJ-class molecular chaperone
MKRNYTEKYEAQSEKSSESLLSDIFELFYGTNTLRPVMYSPFIVGEYTYATDGYALIRCRTEHIDFQYTSSGQSLNVDPIISEVNTSQIIDLDSIDWVSLMRADETVGDGEDIECGHCNGDGSCDDNFSYKGKFYDFEYECPVCDGSGYEEEERQVSTGVKTFSSNDMVKLKDAYFYARNFYRLKKVKDLIGGDVELTSYNGYNRGCMFRIGLAEVLLMPCLASTDDYVVTCIV